MTAISMEQAQTVSFETRPWSSGEKKALWALVLFAALLRLAIIGINEGEYTDGILQITQFSRPNSFWPPLYTALAWPLRQIGLSNIWAGRVVSYLASVLFMWPLVWLARRYAGNRAALYTLAFYAVSAMALRWSVRVMTDILFILLMHGAIAFIADMWSRPLEACDFHTGRCPRRVIAWITLLSVAATLTRYQGLLLLPLTLLCVGRIWWSGAALKKARLTATLLQVTWLMLPIWQIFQSFGHDEQFIERIPRGPALQIALGYWARLEEFVLLSPYSFVLPVFVFFLFGLFARRQDTNMPLKLLFLYIAAAILTAQTFFMSFQMRYLMPLLPLVLTFAGQGAVAAENRLRERHWLFRLAFGVTILWSLIFALSVVYFQRQAFGDIYRAGYYLAAVRDLDKDTTLYTNEAYGPHLDMAGIHLEESSGHPARLMPEMIPSTRESMQPGSLLVLSSRNAGGRLDELVENLARKYTLRQLEGAEFHARIIPLMTDILARGGEQSAMAWVLRYQPQDFVTRIYYIQGLRNDVQAP